MKSIILDVTARQLLPWLIFASLFILYRGHNLPGGGFIGGLVGASGFILLVMGPGLEAAKKALRFDPFSLIGVGLLLAVLSGIGGVIFSGSFMAGLWLPTFSLPLLGTVHLGTPLIFDIGVYLVVMGFTLAMIFSLSEADA